MKEKGCCTGNHGPGDIYTEGLKQIQDKQNVNLEKALQIALDDVDPIHDFTRIIDVFLGYLRLKIKK